MKRRMEIDMSRRTLIIGHKNPDTDSICSAIAYADIKNRISNDGEYFAGRAGEISAETRYVLNRFNVEYPPYIDSVATQVMDMEIRRTPGVSRDITIKRIWELMGEHDAMAQPVTENNKIVGLITKGDLAKTIMTAQDSCFLAKTKPTWKDIADTLEGKVEIGSPEEHFDHGKILVGAAYVDRMQSAIEPGDLIILADREENHIAALEAGAGCLILCLVSEPSETVAALAEKKGAVIITTGHDTFSVSREIIKSIPVGAVMTTDNILTFRTDVRTEEVRRVMSQTRHRAFPVVDTRGDYVGTVSRRNLLGVEKKKVILVDHNDTAQAVDNIEEADVLEIVDHHRIGTLQTMQPIVFNNQPVGCTATILYNIYVEKRIEIPESIAGLLLAAIISDTLMFRSPTCTLADKMAAGALALIVGIDIEAFATEMFEAGSDLRDKSPEEIFFQDYKKITLSGMCFGVGQISSMSADELETIKERIMPILEHECGKNGVEQVYFLLTNIKESSSEMLYAGEGAKALIEIAFPDAPETKDGFYLEGVLSRKKQLLPAFISASARV